VPVVRISDSDLSRLVDRHLRAASAAGLDHIRNGDAFAAHLLDVAVRAEAVAHRVSAVLPPILAPDPIAAFVAGAWHDGGKIRRGDDFHEIASAIDIVEHGLDWGLVRGDEEDARGVLRRAARAVLPGFALHEQWQRGYVPSRSSRQAFTDEYARLAATLAGSGDPESDRALMLPHGVDALVLMYSDICNAVPGGGISDDIEACFAARWRDILASAADDPGLLTVLPVVQPRVRDGCVLVATWLNGRFDATALARYREMYAEKRSSS
jgi:hypothetical protein